MIYLFVLIIILVGIYRFDYLHKEGGKLFYWIFLLIILICISGFRYRMGGDSISYEIFYTRNLNILTQLRESDIAESRFAPGFIIVASLCKMISDDFIVLQFFISIILNSVVFYFFWNNTRHIFFAALLYSFFLYLNLNMEVLRESLAVSVFLLSWPFFRKGKWIYYYLMSLLAFSFHISAVVLFLLPLFWLPGVRWFFQFGARTFIIGSILLILSLFIVTYFYDFVQILAFTDNMSERAEEYATNSIGGTKFNVTGIISHLIQYVLYPCIALYFLNKNINFKKNDVIEKEEFMTIISIYFSLLSVGIFILTRYNNYFLFFSFIIIADWLFSLIRFKNRKIRFNFLTWIFIFVPLFLTFFVSFYMGNVNKEGTLKTYMMYYPYSNQFEKNLDHDRERLIIYARKRKF